MLIDIRLEDEHLARFQNQIAALGDKARPALARAVNRVTRSIHGRVIRAVAKQTGLKGQLLRRSIKRSLAAHLGDKPIQGVVYASGPPLSLKHYGAKQFSFGVRASIWGDTRRFPGAFIFAGHWRSGKPVANGHVYQRTGKGSLPIERITGPSIPDALIAGEAQKAFRETAAVMLPARVSHELGRLLGT